MFNVTPLRFDFEVEKGKSGQDILYVKNPADNDTLDLTISINDFIYSHGKETACEKGAHNRSCASWVTISPKEFKIAPGQLKKVRVRIEIPEDGSGDYWTKIYITEKKASNPNSLKKGKATIEIYGKIQYEVFIFEKVPGIFEKNGKIETINISQNNETKQHQVNFDFRNLSDNILYTKGKIEIRDELGDAISKFKVDRFKVYPNDYKTISSIIPDSLYRGEYSAVVILDYSGKQLAAGEVIFNVEK